MTRTSPAEGRAAFVHPMEIRHVIPRDCSEQIARDAARGGRRARRRGARVRVPDAHDDFNAQWLLARVTWSNGGGRLVCEGALFMIEELAAWGHAVMTPDHGIVEVGWRRLTEVGPFFQPVDAEEHSEAFGALAYG